HRLLLTAAFHLHRDADIAAVFWIAGDQADDFELAVALFNRKRLLEPDGGELLSVHPIIKKRLEVLFRRLLHWFSELIGRDPLPRVGSSKGIHRIVKNHSSEPVPQLVQHPHTLADSPAIPLVVAFIATHSAQRQVTRITSTKVHAKCMQFQGDSLPIAAAE